MTRVGFIGLGRMGGPMAANLAAAQHEVTGYDVVPEAREMAASNGVAIASSAREAVAGAEVVVTMLTRGDVVRAVLTGPNGVMSELPAGAVLVDSSSIDVATTKEMHQDAASRGIHYIDAPVSGGVAGAQQGTLTFMVGGEAETLERARPLLEVMGAKIVHAGAAGSGQAVKTINQMLFGSTLVAVAEAFTLAERLSLDPKVLYDVVTSASGDCWAIRNFCPWPGVVPGSAADADYEPRFAARLMSKDLNLAVDAASKAGQELSIASLTAALYEKLANQQEREIDSSAVVRVIPGSPLADPQPSTEGA
ncbi:MAG: 3-hydroxyisobutyrate dehydrogenase [Streptosporangiales bacterium]|nr:3-hydroxyisobutyrate dehydrogenase [Streptosporangiales bacterium]